MHRDRIEDLFAFMKERYQIFLNRTAGKPKPWTQDRILQKHKFTNCYREDDRVTRWIAKNWRTPHKNDPDLWFAMCVARYINWPDTLEELGYPVPWEPEDFIDCLHNRKADGKQVFTGAYIVHSLGPKIPYLADKVFTPLWKDRMSVRPQAVDSLASFFARLRLYQGMGSFMAGQVVADMKYVQPLEDADDWWEWAAMGPGSARGLNRVIGRPIKEHWSQESWLAAVNCIQDKLAPKLEKARMPRMHAQDLQNCLCEFDKYERVRLGEGRPRSLYPGLP